MRAGLALCLLIALCASANAAAEGIMPNRDMSLSVPAISRERGGHADVREGVASFLEKRPPSFPGKVSSDMPSQYPWWTES
jgi:hypothetical protein